MGTTFTSFGTVNGEPVTQMDVTIATGQVSQRLQSMYGEEFSLDEPRVSLGRLRQAVV